MASFGLHGKGRCVFLGLGEMHRLRDFTGDDGDGPSGWRDARTFVAGMAINAARDPFAARGEGRFALLPDLPTAGAPARVYVRDPGGPGEDAELRWKQNEGSGTLRLDAADAFLTGAFRPPEPGALELSGGGLVARVVVPVRPGLCAENVHFGTDEKLMRAISRYTGGRSVSPEGFGSLVASIRPREQVEVRVHEYSLWHSVWMLLAVVGLVTTEYCLRRRAGMVL